MSDFFKREKELREKATPLPYRVDPMGDITSVIGEIGIRTTQYKNHDQDADYIVFCVNNMHRVCELLERALDIIEYGPYEVGTKFIVVENLKDIRAELEKLK